MVRSMTKRGMPKPFAILIAVVMALYFVPLGALPASANATGNTVFGEFEMDGNFYEGFDNITTATGPNGAPVDWGSDDIKSQVDVVEDPLGGSDPTVFANGSKEDDPANWDDASSASAPGKGDIGNLYVYDRLVAGAQYLFLGFERESSTGTVTYFVELNQKPNVLNKNGQLVPDRTVGDLRIAITQNGNGAFEISSVKKWDGDSFEAVTLPAGSFVLRVNDSPITIGRLPKWTNAALGEKQFVEVSFNLSALQVDLDCPSTGFASAFLRSQSSQENANPELKDYTTGPISVPSNCSQFKIEKRKGNANGVLLPGATFSITPNPLPGQTLPDPLEVTDGGPNDADGAANGTVLINPAKPGTYTVTEVSPPLGYIKEEGSKQVTAAPYAQTPAVLVFSNDHGTVEWEKRDAGTGVLICCATFRVEGTSGAADTLNYDVTVKDNDAPDQDADAGQLKLVDLPTGGYTITETVAPQGYDLPPVGERTRTFTISAATKNVTIASDFTDPRTVISLKVKKVAASDPGTVIKGAVFELWRESGTTVGLQRSGGDADALVGQCQTGESGTCTVGGVTWPNSYYWYEVSVPAPYNLPNQRVQGPLLVTRDNVSGDFATTVYADPQSKIVTQATNGNLPKATISDTATLSGISNDAGGRVTFDLYYTGLTAEPTPNSCTGANVVQLGIPATALVTGPGSYSTGPVPVTKAGYYAWVAHYSGDEKGNRAVDGACDDVNETSYVQPLQPGITTVAQAVDKQLPGIDLFDTAKVSPVTGDLGAGANVDFLLYGPGDTNCAGTPVFTSMNRPVTVIADGNGGFYATATSEHYIAAGVAGTYRWVAQFDGDDNNKDVNSPCNAANESTDVLKAVPAVTTDAGADQQLGVNGASLQDKATLSGGTVTPAIGGSIVFRLYYSTTGPLQASDCTDGTFVAGSSSTVTVNGNGDYFSTPVTVTKAGWYNWTANYEPGADANNADIPPHGCGLDSETVHVTPAQPTITTQVPQLTVTLGPDGSDLTDIATLSGGTNNPAISGTVTFTLYGPFATRPGPNSCVTPLTAAHNPQTVDVGEGNGSYTTANAVRVTQAGFYTWIAAYNGDANNNAATHACGLAGETVQVLPRQPVVSTQISATSLVIAGQGSVSFSDRATISEASNTAGGTISFRLFGPGATVAAACATTGAVQGSPFAVNGNGTYQGPTVSVSAPGFYSWVATYSGDANNLSATHACGLASETVQVFSGQNPTLQKIADPPSGSTVQRGDTIKYTVTVGNTGDVTIDDGVVTDTLPAYVTVDQASVTASGGTYTAGGDRTKSAGTIKWTVDLAPGQTRTFVYNVKVDADAPELATLVNLVEFFGIQRTTTHRVPEGNLTIVKEVSPVAGGGVVVEFGDTLTYTFTATASGQQNQTNVVVTDYLPGFDPARTKSGATTYVPGSATCIGAGTCTVTGPGADGLITWNLGSMAAGTSRQVTFKVTINPVRGAPGESVAVDILNAGAVQSTETAKSPSNEVVTPVTKVFAVKVSKPPAGQPAVLPRTGSPVSPVALAGTAIMLLAVGLLLVLAGQRRRSHRRI